MTDDTLTYLMGEYLDALAVALNARKEWHEITAVSGALASVYDKNYAYARYTAATAAEKLNALVEALPGRKDIEGAMP